MPELPEVETIMRGLEKLLKGREFAKVEVRRKDLRWPLPSNFAASISHKQITKLERRAKYILIHLAHGKTLLLHLGMSGRIVEDDGKAPLAKHDHIIFTTDKGARLRFHDPRRFGMMDVVKTDTIMQHKLLAHLGVEPLENGFTGEFIAQCLRRRHAPIKLAIMDQRLVVGIGNIYASEALFYAGIDPRREAQSLNATECSNLVAAIKKVLRLAISKGGSSLRDYVQADGSQGIFQNEFAVYGKTGEKCKGCTCNITETGGISRIVQGGRATFFCKKKQK
jgi:formamidopyrimidine-DNA glycosylase